MNDKDGLINNLMSIASHNLDDLAKNGFDDDDVNFVTGKFCGYLDALTFFGFENKECRKLYAIFSVELLNRRMEYDVNNLLKDS